MHLSGECFSCQCHQGCSLRSQLHLAAVSELSCSWDMQEMLLRFQSHFKLRYFSQVWKSFCRQWISTLCSFSFVLQVVVGHFLSSLSTLSLQGTACCLSACHLSHPNQTRLLGNAFLPARSCCHRTTAWAERSLDSSPAPQEPVSGATCYYRQDF